MNRVLQRPLGFSVDNDGNVYTVGFYSNNVVVISPDGQRHRQLLSSKDGLSYPHVLDYDRNSHCVVPCKSQHVTVSVLMFV
jgi:hypothetical protein